MRIASALTGLLVAWSLLLVPLAAAADQVVTWPSQRLYSPATPYTFHVEGAEDGTYSARLGGGGWVPVPADGDLTLDLEVGSWTVDVRRCGETCAVVATSPSFDVIDRFDVHYAEVPEAMGPLSRTVRVHWSSSPDLPGTATWRLSRGGTVRASGTAPISTSGAFALIAPPSLPSADDYLLHATFTLREPRLGELSGGSLNAEVRWLAGTAGRVTNTRPVIYPRQDPGRTPFLFPDVTELEPVLVATGPIDTARAQVLDTAGRVVVPRLGVRTSRDERASTWWNGRVQGTVRPGDYVLRMTWTDLAGNRGTVDHPVRVSDLRTEWRTFSRTVTARASLVDRYVGRCASLTRRGSRRGWRGSLGYVTRSCPKPEDSVVMTIHGVRIPRSQEVVLGRIREGRYDGGLEVLTYGGPALGGPAGSRMATRFIPRDRKAGRFHLSERGVRWHRLYAGAEEPRIHGTGAYRGAYWQIGVGGGAQYDVRSFRITVRYQQVVGRP